MKKTLPESAEDLARQRKREELPSARASVSNPPLYDFNRNGSPREIKSHPRSLPAQRPKESPVSDETWQHLRDMEERAASVRIVKIVVALLVFAALAWAAYRCGRM